MNNFRYIFIRSIGFQFDLPKSALYRCFVRVVTALNEIAPNVIRWPSINERKIISEELRKCSGMPGVIGAVDGSYVPIKAPRIDKEAYICRKCFFGITLQAICDHNRRFIDCFAGYPSSVHDSRIFRNSDIYKKICENHEAYFGPNEYILGDKAYPCLSWCIPPYIERRHFTANHRKFNMILAQTRQIIERTFALLFGRFRRLKYLDMNKTELVPCTIIACCVLHNLCLMCETDDLRDEFEEEGRLFMNDQLSMGCDNNTSNVEMGERQNARNINDGHVVRENLFNKLCK